MTHKKDAPNPTQLVHLLEMPNGGASDLALKNEINGITSALERVLALRPVTWHWKKQTQSQQLQHGFIAQEVEAVFPDLVSLKVQSDGTPYKYLSTKALLPYLVKAIDEQQQQIKALERQIEKAKEQENTSESK